MNRRSVPLKNLLLGNTALLALTALMSCVSFINGVYAALYSGLAIIAVLLDAFGQRHPPRFLINIASVGVLASSILRMRFDTVVIVFTEAILLMIAVKMLEGKRSRDYYQIAAMSVLAVISAAVDALDGTFLYFCVLVSLFSGFQLLLAAWFDRDPDSALTARETFQSVSRSLSIWAMMLPICVVLFFIAPRARVSLGQLPRRANAESYTGFSDHITLGAVRDIQSDSSLAFRAEMPLIAPKHLFWRGMIFDVFDGRTWRLGMRGRPGRMLLSGDATVKQEISMEAGYLGALFALDMPAFVNAQGAVPAGDGVFVNGNFRSRLRSYTAISYLSQSFSPDSRGIQRDRYLNLPDGFAPRLRELVGQIASEADGKVPEAIMSYLSPPRYSYTMRGLPTSATPLEDFVFDGRAGNCEYFAAAMAVMLRMAGIPSRLIAGYHGGVYNDSGGYYVVNQSNAHVWVEAWDSAERLWRRYDPTPASGEEGEDSYGGARYGVFWMYYDYMNYQLSRVFL
ncbi:MAG: DUF3488 and transglutaminase-like domain-containing protein, partial [Synergistaceae bacterium]|nr:DUF3488 and transglutaminase-like domain-containing protein [Synergistaceae bacterium]